MNRELPEALQHAEWLGRSLTIGAKEAAAEIRRLFAENAELKKRVFRLESALSNAEFGLPEPKQYPPMPQPQYTTGHCKEHSKPGGCQLHNLQCGYPECDRQPGHACKYEGVVDLHAKRTWMECIECGTRKDVKQY